MVLSFYEDEQSVLIRKSARDFAHTHIKPFIMDWDETQHFPVEVFKKLAGLVWGIRSILRFWTRYPRYVVLSAFR
jgi:alkylation response protein AidB-like acyl-CoA dehydrogenase